MYSPQLFIIRRAAQIIGKFTKQSHVCIVKLKFISLKRVIFSVFHCLNNVKLISYHWYHAFQMNSVI